MLFSAVYRLQVTHRVLCMFSTTSFYVESFHQLDSLALRCFRRILLHFSIQVCKHKAFLGFVFEERMFLLTTSTNNASSISSFAGHLTLRCGREGPKTSVYFFVHFNTVNVYLNIIT